VTSGIRIGTPAVTTRGMREPEMREIASLIDAVLKDPKGTATIKKVRSAVAKLVKKFPLYKNLVKTMEKA
jgi:glycine hydroxymethyltransferase